MSDETIKTQTFESNDSGYILTLKEYNTLCEKTGSSFLFYYQYAMDAIILILMIALAYHLKGKMRCS